MVVCTLPVDPVWLYSWPFGNGRSPRDAVEFPVAGAYNDCMDVKITLPDDVIQMLGPDLERETLEGVLLLLVGDGRMSFAQMGEALGLDRELAARWYARRTLPRVDFESHPLTDIARHVQLEDLTQEELDRSDRFLDMPPAKQGSGFSDVSVNHDKYLADVD